MTDSTDRSDSPSEATTFPQLLRCVAAEYGDDIAITLRGETIADDKISFKELERKSAEFARGLVARGVGKGSRIGFIHGNGPMFAVWLAAIARTGAVAIPISTLIKSNELIRVLRQSDIHGLIVQRALLGQDYVDRLCDALPELRSATSDILRLPEVPYLRWIVTDGQNLPASIHSVDWLTDAKDQISEDLLAAIEAEIHTADQMVEIYTSGSMALPKGVRHHHGPIIARTRYIAKMTQRQRGEPIAAILPMFWVGGMGMYLLPQLLVGGITTCTEGTATSSRHAMGVVLAEEDKHIMAQTNPWWGLGMSETFGPYSYADEFRAEGYPLCAPLDNIAEGFEVRVVDADERAVNAGEIGEIQVRGEALTTGLHKMERADHFTADGFYRTGDLGLIEMRDGKRRIHFTGRAGDMIKTSGANVSPAEVELELLQIDAIQSAYVVGLPDKERGQLVVAALVAREETGKLDLEAIGSELRKRLSGYKVPRAFVEMSRAEVPMLISNKVSRRQLAGILAGRLNRLQT